MSRRDRSHSPDGTHVPISAYLRGDGGICLDPPASRLASATAPTCVSSQRYPHWRHHPLPDSVRGLSYGKVTSRETRSRPDVGTACASAPFAISRVLSRPTISAQLRTDALSLARPTAPRTCRSAQGGPQAFPPGRRPMRDVPHHPCRGLKSPLSRRAFLGFGQRMPRRAPSVARAIAPSWRSPATPPLRSPTATPVLQIRSGWRLARNSAVRRSRLSHQFLRGMKAGRRMRLSF